MHGAGGEKTPQQEAGRGKDPVTIKGVPLIIFITANVLYVGILEQACDGDCVK